MCLNEIFVDVHIQRCLSRVFSTHSGLKYGKFDFGAFHLALENCIRSSNKFGKGSDRMGHANFGFVLVVLTCRAKT
jgi:hypothetical protein